MSNLKNALQELRDKRDQAQKELLKLNEIISGIESLNGFGGSHEPGQTKRTVSLAARRKMALAQKARWDRVRNQSQAATAKVISSAPPRRTMSAASRKKIAAALRARWAKIRAAKKAA
jgi:hypothetical protein